MSQFGISLSVDANKNMTARKNEERIAVTHPCLGGGTGLDRNNEFHARQRQEGGEWTYKHCASVTECYLSDSLSPWNREVGFRQGKRQVWVKKETDGLILGSSKNVLGEWSKQLWWALEQAPVKSR